MLGRPLRHAGGRQMLGVSGGAVLLCRLPEETLEDASAALPPHRGGPGGGKETRGEMERKKRALSENKEEEQEEQRRRARRARRATKKSKKSKKSKKEEEEEQEEQRRRERRAPRTLQRREREKPHDGRFQVPPSPDRRKWGWNRPPPEAASVNPGVTAIWGESALRKFQYFAMRSLEVSSGYNGPGIFCSYNPFEDFPHPVPPELGSLLGYNLSCGLPMPVSAVAVLQASKARGNEQNLVSCWKIGKRSPGLGEFLQIHGTPQDVLDHVVDLMGQALAPVAKNVAFCPLPFPCELLPRTLGEWDALWRREKKSARRGVIPFMRLVGLLLLDCSSLDEERSLAIKRYGFADQRLDCPSVINRGKVDSVLDPIAIHACWPYALRYRIPLGFGLQSREGCSAAESMPVLFTAWLDLDPGKAGRVGQVLCTTQKGFGRAALTAVFPCLADAIEGKFGLDLEE